MRVTTTLLAWTLASAACQKAKTEDDGRLSEEGEGVPGYLTSPENIVVERSDDAKSLKVAGPENSVAKAAAVDGSVTVFIVYADSATVKGAEFSETGSLILTGVQVLAEVAVSESGSFAAEVPFPGAGLLFLSLRQPEAGVLVVEPVAEGGLITLAYVDLQVAGNLLPVASALDGGQVLASVAEGLALGPIIDAPTVMYAKVGVPFAWTFRATGEDVHFDLLEGPAEATMAESGDLSWTPTTAGSNDIIVRAVDAHGLPGQLRVQIIAADQALCLWTGSVSRDWHTAANWWFCNGATPTDIDRVAIGADASRQPLLASDATIDGIGSAEDASGTLTIAADVTLQLVNGASTVAAPITLRGNSADCATCRVGLKDSSSELTIHQGAALTLGAGVTLALPDGAVVNVGDGDTAGHLVAEGASSTTTEWPLITGDQETIGYWGGIKVLGTSSAPSSLAVAGLRLNRASMIGGTVFDFIDYYQIRRFDQVLTDVYVWTEVGAGGRIAALRNCEHAIIDDQSWDSLDLINPIAADGVNIDASDCPSESVAITITGSGGAYGATYANDPQNVVSWTNGASFTCTWSGAVSTSWDEPGNWENCINGRAGVPDQNDWIIVPAATPRNLVVMRNARIRGFGPGPGGGILTVASGQWLHFNADDAFQSDVTLIGPGGSYLRGRSTKITRGARLTLGDRFTLVFSNYSYSNAIAVGDGATAGHLATVSANADASLWPTITGGGNPAGTIKVHGTPSEKSSVSLDGLTLNNWFLATYGGVQYYAFEFVSDFAIGQFDRVSMSQLSYTDTPMVTNSSYIRVGDCASGAFSDVVWDGLDFASPISGAGHNIDLGACTLAQVGGTPLSLTGASGSGAGAAYEVDPNGAIAPW